MALPKLTMTTEQGFEPNIWHCARVFLFGNKKMRVLVPPLGTMTVSVGQIGVCGHTVIIDARGKDDNEAVVYMFFFNKSLLEQIRTSMRLLLESFNDSNTGNASDNYTWNSNGTATNGPVDGEIHTFQRWANYLQQFPSSNSSPINTLMLHSVIGSTRNADNTFNVAMSKPALFMDTGTPCRITAPRTKKCLNVVAAPEYEASAEPACDDQETFTTETTAAAATAKTKTRTARIKTRG